MADSMDLVQARVEEELQRNLANARHQPVGLVSSSVRPAMTDTGGPSSRGTGCYSLRRLSGNRRAEKRPL